ncbi:MAG: glyoxylase-like metal-dependent hydrolase (beta-lactamase superfamily II) [Paraglaciecola sp.]|jgi:glyoxylase-like metal-dependent hydrolase (beta-lactamase superfamily II)
MKWVLRIISSVVILAIIAAGVVLIPAHIQVRGVTPELPSKEELLVLAKSSDILSGPTKLSYILTSSQPLARGQISHTSILVEWENGKRFLIDTGMSQQGAEDFAELLQKMDSSAGEASVKGTISELLGADIKDVAGVGFTHLHIDHTQGINNFCDARGPGAVLLQTASQEELHNFNTTEGADMVSNSCLKRIAFSSDRNESLYKSDQFPGIAAFELGGHTPGSTLWVVALGDKVFLFSGDITNDKASLNHNIPKDALYSYMLVPENTKRTSELRKWLNALDQNDQFSVIVSHDLANAELYLSEFVKQ